MADGPGLSRLFQLFKGMGDFCQRDLSSGRHGDTARMAVEQGALKPFFSHFHTSADGRMCNFQFRCCSSEGTCTGGGKGSLQGFERRENIV
ncbi:hypothetical protein D9M71_686300 [compost metagenome]